MSLEFMEGDIYKNKINMNKKRDRSEELRQWFKTRKALSINRIEKDAGLPFTTLAHVVGPNSARSLPPHHWEALEIELRKYGWK